MVETMVVKVETVCLCGHEIKEMKELPRHYQCQNCDKVHDMKESPPELEIECAKCHTKTKDYKMEIFERIVW